MEQFIETLDKINRRINIQNKCEYVFLLRIIFDTGFHGSYIILRNKEFKLQEEKQKNKIKLFRAQTEQNIQFGAFIDIYIAKK